MTKRHEILDKRDVALRLEFNKLIKKGKKVREIYSALSNKFWIDEMQVYRIIAWQTKRQKRKANPADNP